MKIVVLTAVIILIIAVVLWSSLKHYRKIKERNISFLEAFHLTGLPIITVEHAGKNYNLLLDTGSAESLIDATTAKTMELVPLGEKAEIFGIDGTTIETNKCTIDFVIQGNTYKYSFYTRDLSEAFAILKQEYGVNVHGMLGSNFLRDYSYILDFEKLVTYTKKK